MASTLPAYASMLARLYPEVHGEKGYEDDDPGERWGLQGLRSLGDIR